MSDDPLMRKDKRMKTITVRTETGKGERIRTWDSGRFHLELFDTGRRDWRGQTLLGYELRDDGRLIFAGQDFAGSPMNADDSDATVAALLTFLSLRPGDTDREYFDGYSTEQLEWAESNGEELGWLALEMEERTRAGKGQAT